MRAVLRAGRRRVRREAEPVPVAPATADLELTLDGGGLLNWRSRDGEADALVLVAEGSGRRLVIPAASGSGPRHGMIAVSELTDHAYAALVRTGGREVRGACEPHPPTPLTRNEAPAPGGLWVARTVKRLWVLTRESETVGVRSLALEHGILTLEVGPVADGATLVLAERRGTGRIDVPARRVVDGTARYRLGIDVWSRMRDGQGRPWNVMIATGESEVRLPWRGSSLAVPRDGLRLRGKNVPAGGARTLHVRPYWTKDQFLALEVLGADSTEGNAA